jgi:hypothetical protein
MIVTNSGWETHGRDLLERAPGAMPRSVRLPPARIAFVPFSLDEVEAQPDDPDRLPHGRFSLTPCPCTRSIGILL